MNGILAITFDDGNKTDLTVGLQKQLDRGMDAKGTSFIIGSRDSAGSLSNDDKFTLLDNGWDVQCHTYTHLADGNLTTKTASEIHYEMQQNNAHFASLGLPYPDFMAYPGNAHNKLVRDICGKYRKMARSSAGQFISRKTPKMYLPIMSSYMSGDVVLKEVDMLAKYDYAGTIMLHELETPEQIAAYEALLDYVLVKRIKLVTFTELYKLLT